jgi:hypothetical protein
MLAFWSFAFKYFKSSCTMPGVFGGKEISERKNKCLNVWNYTMIILIFILSAMAYSFMLTAKWRKSKNKITASGGTISKY